MGFFWIGACKHRQIITDSTQVKTTTLEGADTTALGLFGFKVGEIQTAEFAVLGRHVIEDAHLTKPIRS